MQQRIDLDLAAAKAEHFNQLYFNLHEQMLQACPKQESRNGQTVEITAFKTTVTNPLKRCIGGYNRNINVFFLLAEALWIFAGRKDVAFLDTYNGQLKEYSDDGLNYHAPYGYRIRCHGRNSITDHQWQTQAFDQLPRAIEMLAANPDDRRVVLQIWNADLDLGTKSKDLPCNDLVFWKIRNGKLLTTISNRSNDLNLGLTTNFFQFSFLSELAACALKVKLGAETHCSDSLHIYNNFKVTQDMVYHTTVTNAPNTVLLYDVCAPLPMVFDFTPNLDAVGRFNFIDDIVKVVITVLHKLARHEAAIDDLTYVRAMVEEQSPTMFLIYNILQIYVLYKNKQLNRASAINELMALMDKYGTVDYLVLAMNFFAKRMRDAGGAEREWLERFIVKQSNPALKLIGRF